MIILPATGANPRTSHYWHTKASFKAVNDEVADVTECCFCSCETVIPAFAYLDDTNNKEFNDCFFWLLTVPTDATVVATLTNLDTATDYVITDNTYGILYDVDVLKDNTWAFIVKWANVATEIGYGNYQLNITVSDFNANEIFNKDYPKFKLLPYTCENAHGTVRIESWNSGYIEGGFDYRGISIDNPFTSSFGSARKLNTWIQQIRYYGRLTRDRLPTQTDNHWDNLRNLTQVQTQIQNGWNLRLDFIKADISYKIIYDNLLGDFLYLSDYNANNIAKFRDVKVSLEAPDDPQTFLDQTEVFNIKFVDYKQNLLKRNF